MELILLMGIQASGKSTFCRERLFRTHLRINLDMLKTRHREERLMQVCFETQLPFVVDNTNVTREQRAKYIETAKRHGFTVVGYCFQSKIHDCLARNEKRPVEEQVPKAGVLSEPPDASNCRPLTKVLTNCFTFKLIPKPRNSLSKSFAGRRRRRRKIHEIRRSRRENAGV